MEYRIIEREAWTSVEKAGPIDRDPFLTITVHHFSSPHVPLLATREEEEAALRGVKGYHKAKMLDFGYNFAIAKSGRIYEGRGFNRRGAHVKGRNKGNMGVAFMVDGENSELTPVAIEAFKWLVREGRELGYISPEYQVLAHRDQAATVCPGDKVYAQMHELNERTEDVTVRDEEKDPVEEPEEEEELQDEKDPHDPEKDEEQVRGRFRRLFDFLRRRML